MARLNGSHHKPKSAGSLQNYTAEDYGLLFEDANLTLAQEISPYLIGNLSAKTASPGTHFYGFYGSGKPLISASARAIRPHQ